MHRKILNILSYRIFKGEFKAGEKLPTEQALSKEMGVDKTSLRISLKQLELLNVLDIRQGDGMYVKDYSEYAGMDFLRILFSQQDANEAITTGLLDGYMVDEVIEFWIEFLPSMLRLATKKYSSGDIRRLQALYDEELQNIHDKPRMVEIELRAHDEIAKSTANLILRSIINSLLPLREVMMTLFYTALGDDFIRKDIENRKELLNVAFTGSKDDIDAAIASYKQVLTSYRKKAREIWSRLPGDK